MKTLTMPSFTRLFLHIACAFRRPRNFKFHLAGIAREFHLSR